ncbi:FtsX-like permease family protein [Bacillus spongiae]|uniref:FtsX-like permease family protein n=1 Tax=Bacillus spongiae TaxID=2683610 RepID=A0ABU8HE30_9BACI
MNIVNKLTVRHLKKNKKRTLVTMIGVIISVAMLTAVATIGFSFLDLLQRQTIADEGEWHVQYEDVNKDQLEAIQKDDATGTVEIERDRGFAYLEGSQNPNRPYLFIKEYNAQNSKKFPVELSEGRLPKTANEVVLSEEIVTNAKVKYEIGDKLTLDVGNRVVTNSENGEMMEGFSQFGSLSRDQNGEINEEINKQITLEYTVVGFIKRPNWEPSSAGYTIISYLDETMVGENDVVNASVILKEVDQSLYTHAEALAKTNNIQSVYYHNSLLQYYGVTDDDPLQGTLLTFFSILMSVIMIGSVSLIYNAFAISVSERTRHLGMLSSVGATGKQKRNSVFFEGALIGLISIPLGIVGGLAGIGVTFWVINSLFQEAFEVTESLKVTVTPLTLLITSILSVLTIFISTYLPARKAAKISAIDAIRQATEVKLTGKTVKTSKLIRKLFGFEAEVGLKNLKRNKRKYQATVFSLVISIVLFLTVSFFTDNLKKSVELTQEGIQYDIVVHGIQDKQLAEQLVKAAGSMDEVTEYYPVTSLSGRALIDQSELNDELKNQVKNDPSILQNGHYSYFLKLIALDEETLKAYAKDVGLDYETLQSTENIAGIVINRSFEIFNDNRIESETIQTAVGEKIDINTRVNIDPSVEQNNSHMQTVEIAAKTDQLPVGVSTGGFSDLNVVVSKAALAQLYSENEEEEQFINTQLFINSKDPLATQYELEAIDPLLFVSNEHQYRQQEENMILIISVFTYGFIVLITLISVANIFNTISTSISLRKREFAMLKSVGMTPKGFNKMIRYESIFYGLKSLLYGLPISLIILYLMHRSLMNSFTFDLTLPWARILFVIAVVLLIVGGLMQYSSAKIKKENIIDALKQENI